MRVSLGFVLLSGRIQIGQLFPAFTLGSYIRQFSILIAVSGAFRHPGINCRLELLSAVSAIWIRLRFSLVCIA